MTRPAIPVAILSLALLPGCVSIWHFNDLEKRVADLETQKTELEAQQARDREDREHIRKELVDATEALRRGGANLGADVDALKSDVARLRGTDEELAFGVGRNRQDVEAIKKTLDERLGAPIVQLPQGVAEDRDALFKAGREAFDRGDDPTARGALRRFVETFPDEPRAAEAQFLIGETFFRAGQYGQAVREFQGVHDRYRTREGAPVGKALVRIAEALLKQGDCRKASDVYKYVIDFDKKAPEADKAKKALAALKKTCK